MFHYGFEYRVALYGESVVYLVPVLSFSVNVKFFKGVEHFFPFSYSELFIISSIVPKECPSLMTCWANVDLLFEYLKSL